MKEKKILWSGPHFPTRDLKATLDYYRDKLGFKDEWTFGATDGGISRDGMGLLFGENPTYNSKVNDQVDRLPLIWFVDHMETVLAEFQGKGIEVADAIREHPYGIKEFAFIDINGYYIRVSEATTETG